MGSQSGDCRWPLKILLRCFLDPLQCLFSNIETKVAAPQSHKVLLITLGKKHTIHQVTTMLATFGTRSIIEVSDHQYWWLVGGYDLEIGHF